MYVSYKRELERHSSKKKGSASKQRRKNDMIVDAYCAEHPLNMGNGSASRLFLDKGEAMHPDMAALFSKGLPEAGLQTLKSMLYNHVLSPHYGMARREMWTSTPNNDIYKLKGDIVSMITDPFWKAIESSQKFGSYDWNGYASLVPHITAQYADQHDPIPDWVHRGIQMAVDELPDDITPISLEESIAYCRTDTNAGFPTFSSRPFMELTDDGLGFKVTNPEHYYAHLYIAKSVWEGTAHTNIPATLFKRIQPGEGPNSKTRIVECVSRGILWAEGRVWRPILEAMRKIPAYSGYMHHSNGLGSLVSDALSREHTSSLDYSAYDSRVGRFLPSMFQALAAKIPSASQLFDWSARYYRTCPLLTPHGFLEGDHGLFSGMFGTSFAGSLINRGLVLGLMHHINEMGMTMENVVHAGFGDDTILAWDGHVQIDLIIDILQQAGMVLNESKQEYCGPDSTNRYLMFQACYWRHNPGAADHCVPIYPLVRCASRLAFFENVDPHTKLVYASGNTIDGIECPEVVGLIVSALISKLSEAEHHPDIKLFINRYQGAWLHYMNPFQCVTDEGVLRYISREYIMTDGSSTTDFLSHPIVCTLIDGLKTLPIKERLEISAQGMKDICAKLSSHRKVMSEGGIEDNLMSELVLREAMIEDGFSEGLVNSILMRIPQEAYE